MSKGSLASGTGDSLSPARFDEAIEALRRINSGTNRQRSRLARNAPLSAIQSTALFHPDPFIRRKCLFFLDHYANDESMDVFAKALGDPVDFVRNAAMHSLSCETCKVGELCAADVVPGVVNVLEHDHSPDMRTKAIPLLLRLSWQDERARTAVVQASLNDPDQLVRQAALDGLAGRFVLPRKRYERRQRRHARTAPRTLIS